VAKIKKTVARVDPKYGVIHRDISHSYELAMFKKYGYNWKQKIRKLAESLRHKEEQTAAVEPPVVQDVKPVEPEI
jgi:hypothetical protein